MHRKLLVFLVLGIFFGASVSARSIMNIENFAVKNDIINKEFYENQIPYTTKNLDCGSLLLQGQGSTGSCKCNAKDNEIKIGESGEDINFRVTYEMHCPGAADDGECKICIEGTSICDSAKTGTDASGTLQVSKKCYRGETVRIKLSIKYTDWWGSVTVCSCTDYSTNTFVSDNSCPSTPDTPEGDSSGVKGTPHTFSTSSEDPDGDKIYIKFDWDDGTDSGWVGPYNSGAKVDSSHTWSDPGTYYITAIAKDDHECTSSWSESKKFRVTKGVGYPILDGNIRFDLIFKLIFQFFLQ